MRGSERAVSGSPPRRPCETGRSHSLLRGLLPHPVTSVALVSWVGHLAGPGKWGGHAQGLAWVLGGQKEGPAGHQLTDPHPTTCLPLCLEAQPCPHRHLPMALLPPGLLAHRFPRLCMITARVTEIRSNSTSPAAGTVIGSILLCGPTGIHRTAACSPRHEPRGPNPVPRSARRSTVVQGQRLRHAANWLRCERNCPLPT